MGSYTKKATRPFLKRLNKKKGNINIIEKIMVDVRTVFQILIPIHFLYLVMV